MPIRQQFPISTPEISERLALFSIQQTSLLTFINTNPNLTIVLTLVQSLCQNIEGGLLDGKKCKPELLCTECTLGHFGG